MLITKPRIQCYGRIKPGTKIWQDFRGAVWPLLGADPNTRFRFEDHGEIVWALAPGFGEVRGNYGNGPICLWRR